MSHDDKKQRTIDSYAQSIILNNLDIMAIISGFLQWHETIEYILVCKTWQKSFDTRPWGSPPYINLPHRIQENRRFRCLDLSINHIKHVKSAHIHSHLSKWINFILPVRIKEINIFCNYRNVRKLLAFKDHNLTHITLFVDDLLVPEGLDILLDQHKNTLTELSLSCTVASIPPMPNLTKLHLNPDMMPNIGVYRCLSECPSLKCLEVTYLLEEQSAYLNDLYRLIGLQTLEIFALDIQSSLVLDVTRLEPIINLPILLRSTLKNISISIYSRYDGVIGNSYLWIKDINPNQCKICIELVSESDYKTVATISNY